MGPLLQYLAATPPLHWGGRLLPESILVAPLPTQESALVARWQMLIRDVKMTSES